MANYAGGRLSEKQQRELNEKLFNACEEGNTEEAVQFIADGADVDYQRPGYLTGFTILEIASFKGHVDTVQQLLAHNASINKRDEIQSTAFLWSCVGGDMQTVRLLYDSGADVKAIDGLGRTAVHYGCMSGNTELIQFLLSLGLSLQDTDENGSTVMHHTSAYGHLELLKWLMSQGVSLSTTNKKGETCIFDACREGHLEVIKFLVSEGLSVDSQNKEGKTPMDVIEIYDWDDADDKERKKKCLDYLQGKDKGVETSDPLVPDASSKPVEKDDQSSGPSNEQRKTKDDQRMTELIKAQIKKKGGMELCNVKGILIGPPGAGKTVTINRLTGQMKNIRFSGGMKSTGVDKPQTFHIYHDTEKKSIFIGKFWSDQSLDEQLGTILHCMIHRPISLKIEEDCDGPLEPLQEKEHVPVPKEAQSLSVAGIPHQSISSPSQSTSFPMDAYFVLLQEFIRQSKWDTVQSLLKSVNDATLFHVIDTGGQPEFFEILPLLLRGPCFSLIFLNLALSLKKPFQVTYRDTPTTHSLVEYRSTYTQLDMVHMLLASIHSLNRGKEFSQRSAAFLIGTHLDEAKSSDVIQITREIEESLKGKSFYHQDVLDKYFCHERKLETFLYALDNMNGSEEEISLLRDILTHLIKSIFPAEKLPTSWGVFHLMLRHKYEEKGLCTVEESEILAKACEMLEEDEVKLALRFLHNRFGTILYYPEIESLKSLVICDPNNLFRPITCLVAKSFGANAVHPETAKAIRKSGEITHDFFEEVCNENDPLQRIPTEAIVDLLKHHNIITEIGNGDRRLFMSCLLEPCTGEEKVEISSTQEVAPLLFTFYPQGYQPICLFHVLISMLLQSKEFELDKPRFRNKIKFKAGKAIVVIWSFTSHLQVQVKRCSPKRCVQVRESLEKKLNSIVSYIPHMRDTRVDVSFPCPKATTTGCSHVAKLRKFEPLEDEESSVELFCEECDDSMDLESCHKMWFDDIDDCKSKEGKTQVQSEKDSSLILRKCPDVNDAYKLLKPKAAYWSKIARELDVDTGYRNELQMLASLDAKDKLECVIVKWKESECSDFTWGTLIEALKELEYVDVVRSVQEFLAKPDVNRKYQNRKEFLRCE